MRVLLPGVICYGMPQWQYQVLLCPLPLKACCMRPVFSYCRDEWGPRRRACIPKTRYGCKSALQTRNGDYIREDSSSIRELNQNKKGRIQKKQKLEPPPTTTNAKLPK